MTPLQTWPIGEQLKVERRIRTVPERLLAGIPMRKYSRVFFVSKSFQHSCFHTSLLATLKFTCFMLYLRFYFYKLYWLWQRELPNFQSYPLLSWYPLTSKVCRAFRSLVNFNKEAARRRRMNSPVWEGVSCFLIFTFTSFRSASPISKLRRKKLLSDRTSQSCNEVSHSGINVTKDREGKT